MTRRVHAAAAGPLIAGMLCLTPLGAQSDPMRPLAGATGLKEVSSQPTASGHRSAIDGQAPAVLPSPPPPRLVAIRQDSQGVWHALFDERWLTIGDRLGTLRVAAIDAGAVSLREGRQTRTVHLLPVLVPTPSAASASSAQGKPSRGSARPARRPALDTPTASTALKPTP